MNENLRATMKNSVRVVLMVSALAVTGAAVAAKKPASASAQAPIAASAPLPAGAIARVNGVTIPASDLDAAVRASRQPDTPALRTSLKNQLIARELFRQAAQKQHYDAHADVQAIVEQTKTTAMMQAYLKDVVKPAPVTDDEVKSKYDAIVATLGENEYKP
ncbi:MAG: peptidyl-prolyl cis-trans isomerase, partial [Trinickia sp.]